MRVSRGQEPIETWSNMKDRLKEKFVPSYYYDCLLDRWHRISKGQKSANEYVSKFYEFLNHYNILDKKSDAQVLFQFQVGLRVDLKDELWAREITELKRA